MKKWLNTIILVVFIVNILSLPSTAKASHTDFLEKLVFPVKNIMSHFYDDWNETRGNGDRTHDGLDIRSSKGTPIVAVADGVVNTIAYSEASGYYLAIDHGNGWLSLYVHLNDDLIGNDNLGGYETAFAEKIYVGAVVVGGQEIGYIGDSGNAEGTVPHVHFELRYNGVPQDIYKYIKASFQRFEISLNVPKKVGLNVF